MDYTEIAAAARARRHELGLTQDETASLANIDRRTLSEFENSVGVRGISLRNLLSICEVLGLAVQLTPLTRSTVPA